MYKDYFGFKEDPFSIAPDPQFLYMSDRHREALAHLIYGMKADSGFILLTGEVGTGKTTVCRCLLGQVPENSEIAFILNPKLSVIELLATICDELGIIYPIENSSVKVFIDLINSYLLNAHSQGKQIVLIIDEAQNLSVDVLEQIRLLTNLETDKRKLLQVIMLGQPELNTMLEQQELRQLAQRVTARYHLDPLSKNEIEGYINHRLAVAGVERQLFPSATVSKLYNLTGGVPRLINLLSDRALLGAYVKELNIVSPALLAEAANEVFGKNGRKNSAGNNFSQWLLIALLSLILVLGGAFLVLLIQQPSSKNVVEIQGSLAPVQSVTTESETQK
jgi:general secretion pathway protein A